MVLLTGFASCIGTDIVDDPTFEPTLVITPRIDSMMVGQSQQFMAEYTDEFGDVVDTPATWTSSNPAAFSMDAQGLVMCLDTGGAFITASVGSVADTLYLNTPGVTNVDTTSNPVSRVGTFQDGAGSYRASGVATLENDGQGNLILNFGSDFSSSNGPAVYVVLANNTTGPYLITPGQNDRNNIGVQISPNKISSSGAMTFAVPAGVEIDDYDYVVLWCITVNGLFGFAELN